MVGRWDKAGGVWQVANRFQIILWYAYHRLRTTGIEELLEQRGMDNFEALRDERSKHSKKNQLDTANPLGRLS